MTAAVIIVGAALFAVFMKTHARHRSPAKAAVTNMLLGAGSLCAASLFLGGISVNLFTTFAALTLGLPGTALIILGRFL